MAIFYGTHVEPYSNLLVYYEDNTFWHKAIYSPESFCREILHSIAMLPTVFTALHVVINISIISQSVNTDLELVFSKMFPRSQLNWPISC